MILAQTRHDSTTIQDSRYGQVLVMEDTMAQVGPSAGYGGYYAHAQDSTYTTKLPGWRSESCMSELHSADHMGCPDEDSCLPTPEAQGPVD